MPTVIERLQNIIIEQTEVSGPEMTKILVAIGDAVTDIQRTAAALEEAGLIEVVITKEKSQIVCRPGRKEHAKHALDLEG